MENQNDNSGIKTIRVRYHHEDSGQCQTTFKAVGENRYYNRIEHGDFGCWHTVYPSQGLWESSGEVRDDIVFEVLDNDGNILFTEGNGNLGAFKSIGTKAREIAAEYERSLSLSSHEEWRAWLLGYAGDCGFTGESDNWLYWKPNTRLMKPMSEYMHLGLKFRVLIETVAHPVCGKTWNIVYIQNLKSEVCEAICGYHLDVGPVSPVMVKSLSQLKKLLKEGAEFCIVDHCRPEVIGERRRVNAANSVGIYVIIPDDPDCKVSKANGGRGGYLGWSKASFWEFREDGVCALYSSDKEKKPANLIVAFRLTDVSA